MSTMHLFTHGSAGTEHGPGRVEVGLRAMEGVLAASALGAGAALLAHATSFDDRTVADLPLHSQAFGAAALMAVNGVVPLTALVLAVRHHRLAPFAHLLVGPALIVWIIVEASFIGWSSPLQPACLAFGAVLAVLAVVALRPPGTRRT